MSAETLRRAANLMRERARRSLADIAEERWTASPTIDPDNHGWVVAYDHPAADWDTTVAQLPYDYEGDTAPHVASWHPAVALAVADWLDSIADIHDLPLEIATASNDGVDALHIAAIIRNALAVAHAYLGDPT